VFKTHLAIGDIGGCQADVDALAYMEPAAGGSAADGRVVEHDRRGVCISLDDDGREEVTDPVT
jgi:hypothetical protein